MAHWKNPVREKAPEGACLWEKAPEGAHAWEKAPEGARLQEKAPEGAQNQNLKIILNSEGIAYTLENSPPVEAPTGCSPEELQTYKDWCDQDLRSKFYMQASMNDELQRCFEGAKHAVDIHFHLKELFGEQKCPIIHASVKELITLRLQDGDSVHEHGARMIGLVEKLVDMDLVLPVELTIDVLLLSLPSSFDFFVVNFNMNKIEPTFEEL
ncbi:uncharacterized protein [Henckelia pumila]|uniref:uncharacterized protein n=1 Tax=Henckelia pumila TaxID=405737 RepID=UPI003C6DFFF9